MPCFHADDIGRAVMHNRSCKFPPVLSLLQSTFRQVLCISVASIPLHSCLCRVRRILAGPVTLNSPLYFAKRNVLDLEVWSWGKGRRNRKACAPRPALVATAVLLACALSRAGIQTFVQIILVTRLSGSMASSIRYGSVVTPTIVGKIFVIWPCVCHFWLISTLRRAVSCLTKNFHVWDNEQMRWNEKNAMCDGF